MKNGLISDREILIMEFMAAVSFIVLATFLEMFS